VFPWLGTRPIAEIRAPELLAVLRRIESRGAQETAHRAMQNCGQVFRYAVATGRAERDPTGDLRGALPPPKEKHHASIIEPKAIGQLLRAIVDAQVRTWFEAEPERTGKELFKRLQSENPDVFPDGQLRTFQRRIKQWRRVAAQRLVFAGDPHTPAVNRLEPVGERGPFGFVVSSAAREGRILADVFLQTSTPYTG
jgi:hypothetical protein